MESPGHNDAFHHMSDLIESFPSEFPQLADLTTEQLQHLYVRNKRELTKHVSAGAGAEPGSCGENGWFIQWYRAPPGVGGGADDHDNNEALEEHSGLEHQDVPDKKIAQALDAVMYFLGKGRVGWVTGPGDQKRLEHFLAQKDFVVAEEAPTMAADLRGWYDELDPLARPRGCRGVDIIDVDAAHVRAWVQTWSQRTRSARSDAWVRIYASVLNALHRKQFAMFIATLDGEDVGTGYLHCYAGVASIHAVHVKPKARGRGIGGALMRHAMRRASLLGYNVATVTASNSKSAFFERLGFRPFGHVKLNVWRPLHKSESKAEEKSASAVVSTTKSIPAATGEDNEEEDWCLV